MIIFIEGPDHAGKDELYRQLIESMDKERVLFYDILDSTESEMKHMPSRSDDCKFHEMSGRIATVFQLSAKLKNMHFVVNYGPLYLLEFARKNCDVDALEIAESILFNKSYQNVGTITVWRSPLEREDDSCAKDEAAYRKTISANMQVFEDKRRGNQYLFFINKCSDKCVELFVNDVTKLINNKN
jgi:hypothetical protein